MKKQERNGIAKRIISILLILAIVLPYFPLAVFATEGENSQINNIEFNSRWISGNQKEEGTTDDTFGFNYSIQFNNIETGYQNVKILIETDTPESGSVDTITLMGLTGASVNSSSTGSGYAIVNLGNVDKGVSISGQASVNFKNINAKEDNRNVSIKVTGTYRDPATGETRKIEDEVEEIKLNASVTPSTIITPYNADLTWQKYKTYGTTNERKPTLVKGNSIALYGEEEYGTQSLICGWYTTNVVATYPIHVYSREKTQKLELKVTINRFDYDDNLEVLNKMSEGYTINWGELETDLGTPTETVNSDGSVTYTFTKGTDSNTYDSNSAFIIDKEYNVVVTYNTPNTNPKGSTNADKKTNASLQSTLTAKGFKLTKEYDKEESGELIETTKYLSDTRGIDLNSYAPGKNSWLDVTASSMSIGAGNSSYTYGKINSYIRDQFKETGKAQISAEIGMQYMSGQYSNQTGQINLSTPKLRYVKNNSYQTISLTPEQMKLKAITEGEETFNSSFVSGTYEREFDGTYNASEDVNEFSIKLTDFLANKKSGNYVVTYELDKEALGLTDEEIDSIQYIYFNLTTSGSGLLDGTDTFIIYKETETSENNYSYMQLGLSDNFNFTSEDLDKWSDTKTISLKMFKNSSIFADTDTKRNYVVNENPVFFVSLPGYYDLNTIIDYDILDIKSTSSDIRIDDFDLVEVNDQYYISIVCAGTYDSRIMDEVDINITFRRSLLDAASRTFIIDAYMLTDNENYYRETRNTNKFNKEGLINGDYADKIGYTSARFNVVGINRVETVTEIERERELLPYRPTPSNGVINDSEKEQPLIIGSNNKVIYNSKIITVNETIRNISILSRLPIANNTFIENTTKPILESDFKFETGGFLSEEKYGNKVNGFAEGDVITQTSLTNLNIIGLYKIDRGIEMLVEPSKYKVYLSSEANADMDSSSFVDMSTLTDPDDLANALAQAKNLKVVLNDDQILSGEKAFILKYEMTMPDQIGMVGSETSVRYTKGTDTEVKTLNSPAAYIINGDVTSTLKVQKLFENYPKDTVPSGYGVNSLANIQFKLQYYNEAGNREILKNESNEDIIATTDEHGIATFDSIPGGRYFIYEETEFENYSGIGKLNVVNLKPGETKKVNVTNNLKRGNLIINKRWQGTNATQGQVTLQVNRIKADGETYTFEPVTVSTDENDNAYIINVPYGKYSITESSGQTGWVAEEPNKQVDLDTEEKIVEYNNIPSKATLKIVKTVPRTETVSGLTFKVIGRSSMKNQNTLTFNPNPEITFTIDAANNPENVTIEKSENDTKATITITDLYLGYYNVEEIEIPTIDGTELTKYPGVGGSALLSQNGETQVVNLVNNHKYGKIVINKTAKLKDGTNYQNIDDLSGFKVRVTGHSFYDNTNQINEVLNLDEDGHAEIELEIGKYTVTELPVDGYTSYYGTNSSASTVPQELTLEENGQVVTQNIYNEHTGVGYVRVEKTLEGVTNPQDVINKGIKFAVVGRNVAKQPIGQTIEGTLKGELIEINQIDTEKNVAYGMSGPISVGGEYELQEIQSTVPEYYEAYEPTIIEVTTSNTISNPNVVNIENKKSKGNLEMITTTNPEGGPLTGIKYVVTPVKLNSDATYTNAGESQIVEGSNDVTDTSFAKLEDIYAGFYSVEIDATSVPAGWKNDVKQIVEVPSYNTGYANFELTQKKQMRGNKVTIKKNLYDENDEIATDEYIENAKLNKNEKFEIKITNVDTREEYYVFTSVNEPGVITGLDAGTYTIEEVYKPKYINLGYNKEIIIPPSIEDGTVEPQVSKEALENNTFTLEAEGTTIKDLTLVVDNKINTSFGFGGQDSKDNLSKIELEEQQEVFVTKAVIYVTDEQNKAISGLKFQLLNSEEQAVTLSNMGSEFEINNKKLIIKGLPVGKYTLRCTHCPEEYLKPDDKEIIVYSDSTQVARVEVQKNIPRGNITLSTVYNKKNGDQRYITYSEYKVVNHATGELVKFIRTPTGNYKKSNSDEASPVVILKAGPVELQGLEVGEYEVGIVGVKQGYGIIKDEPEYVTVEQNLNKNIVTTVINKTIVQIDAGRTSTSYLDVNGNLYMLGHFADESYAKFEKINFPENVKIAKYSQDNNNLMAVDTDGKVWFFGTIGNDSTMSYYSNYDNYTYRTINGKLNYMMCLSGEGELATAYQDGVRFVDVKKENNSALLLDSQGRVWGLGNVSGEYNSGAIAEIKPIQEFIDNNVKIARFNKNKDFDSESTYAVIDTSGKLWIWGRNSYEITGSSSYVPVCYSDTTELRNVILKDVAIGYNAAVALDEDGNVWLWGRNTNLQGTIQGGEIKSEPTIVNSANFNGAKIKEIACLIENGNDYCQMIAVVDEYGKVWTWGKAKYGELGNGYPNGEITIPGPSCISNSGELKDVDVKDIVVSQSSNGASGSLGNEYGAHVVVLDSNNRMWAWGSTNKSGAAGQGMTPYVYNPQRLYTIYNEHLEYNLRFKKVFGHTSSNHYAIDEDGRLWVWGDNLSGQLGVTSKNVAVPTIVEIPGNPKIEKVDTAYNNAIILSEDGRVFICGYAGYTGGAYSNYIPLTEITNNFTTRIVDVVATNNNSYIALDSNGNVFTWGSTSGPIGRSDNTSSITAPLTENIIKISASNNTGFAVYRSGALMYWKGTSTVSGTSISSAIIDVEGNFVLDDEGHIWYFNGSSLSQVTKSTSHNLNSKYDNSSYKIVEMYKLSDQGSEVMLKDSNGDYWYQSSTSNATKFDTGIKDIISISKDLLVDKYGQIWSYEGNTATSIMATTKTKNPAYGLKFDHIISDSLLAGKDGKIYSKADFSEVTNTTAEWSDTVNTVRIQGKKMVAVYGRNYSYSSSKQNVFLDENDKLWWYTSANNLTCLNGEGSVLNGVNISKIYGYKLNDNTNNNSYTFFVIDDSGNVYSWGANTTGQCGNGSTVNVDQPVKLNITGIKEIKRHCYKKGGASFSAIDNDGNVYVWGENSEGFLGNGSTENITIPYRINLGEGIKVIDIDVAGSHAVGGTDHGVLLCEDGKVYASTNTTKYWNYIGDCVGGTTIERTTIDGSTEGRLCLIFGNNKIWRVTYGAVSQYTTECTPQYVLGNTIIDENGQWVRYASNSVVINEKIVVKSGNYLYSIDGKRYTISDTGTVDEKIDVSGQIIAIYGELNEENIIKYSKLGRIEVVNGKVWSHYAGTNDSYLYTLNNLPDSPMKDKTIVECDSRYAIDLQGDLYYYDSGNNKVTCLTRDEYLVSEATVKANNNIINMVEENNLYGVKFKDVANDKFAIDVEGNVWYFLQTGPAKNLTAELQGTLNPMYEKEIDKMINQTYLRTKDNEIWYVGGNKPEYIMKAMNKNYTIIKEDYSTLGYEYCVALDQNGKIWACGINANGLLGNGATTTNDELVCISDIEGTELYEAKQNNPDFKIVDTHYYTSGSIYVIFAIDNSGKVWAWGTLSSGSTGKVLSPICISEQTATNYVALHDAYYNDNAHMLQFCQKTIGTSTVQCMKDSNNELWSYSGSKWQKVKSAYPILDAPDTVRIVDSSTGCLLTADGDVYTLYLPAYTDINGKTYNARTQKYKKCDGISNVTALYDGYSTSSRNGTTTNYVVVSLAKTENGIYEIKYTYSMTGTTISDYNVTATKIDDAPENIVKSAGNLYLDSEGKLWLTGKALDSNTYYTLHCLSTDEGIFNGKTITDIEKNGYYRFVTDSENNLYLWATSSGNRVGTTPALFDKDEALVTLYGEANNENRKKYCKESVYFYKDGKIYKLAKTGITEVEVDFMNKYFDGIGKITQIVGEWEVKTDEGKIYRIIPNGVSTYTYSEVTSTYDFTTATPETPLEIEGVTIKKQVKHKAIDTEGNLYVWDTYTGINKEITGYLNLTGEKYVVDPIYNHGDGWVVIKGSK